jgi:hypothetical protein
MSHLTTPDKARDLDAAQPDQADTPSTAAGHAIHDSRVVGVLSLTAWSGRSFDEDVAETRSALNVSRPWADQPAPRVLASDAPVRGRRYLCDGD